MAIKGPFCRLPPPIPIYRPAFHPPPPPPKIKQPTCIFTGYHSQFTDEQDTLSDSSSPPNSARLIIPGPLPLYPATIKKIFNKIKKKLCIVFKLFCLVNNFMIWKRKKKEKEKETFNGGGWIRTRNLWITKLAPIPLSYQNQLHLRVLQNMYLYSIWRLGPYDLWPVQSHNSNFDLKNLIKCIIKVVNVSKSQYYEFRHNIMNLGNQNSKYSWRIRDLENPQTRTQFANSVLMYKIVSQIFNEILRRFETMFQENRNWL